MSGGADGSVPATAATAMPFTAFDLAPLEISAKHLKAVLAIGPWSNKCGVAAVCDSINTFDEN
jgi:hypothetical protein